jgi:hypothetical protein
MSETLKRQGISFVELVHIYSFKFRELRAGKKYDFVPDPNLIWDILHQKQKTKSFQIEERYVKEWMDVVEDMIRLLKLSIEQGFGASPAAAEIWIEKYELLLKQLNNKYYPAENRGLFYRRQKMSHPRKQSDDAI